MSSTAKVPDWLHHKVGVMRIHGELWGYLQVRRDVLTVSSWLGLRKRLGEEALIVEFFRLMPPRPTDVDAQDELGLSDSVVVGDNLAQTVQWLEQGQFPGYGAPLDIEWLEGAEAEDVIGRYFAASNFD